LLHTVFSFLAQFKNFGSNPHLILTVILLK
jgi:hypothetical protein